MNKNRIFILLTLLTLFACQKDPVLTETTDEIRIGDKEKMIFQILDLEVLGSLNIRDSVELDLNNDNINDFKITSEIWGSQTLGLHPTVMVKSLNNNCFVNGKYVNDSIFYNYVTDTVYDALNDVVKIYYLSTYTCSRISDQDVVVGIDDDEYVVNFFNQNATIQKTDVFETGEFNLSQNYAIADNGPIANHTNDTLYYFRDTDYFNCSSIPNFQNTYIGIKLMDNNIEKLGWIKLKVEIDYRVTLLETAIQE